MTVLQFPTDRARPSGTGKTPPRLERAGVVALTPRDEPVDAPSIFLDELRNTAPGLSEAIGKVHNPESKKDLLRRMLARRRVNATPVRDDIWDEYKIFDSIIDKFDVNQDVDAPIVSANESAMRDYLKNLLEFAKDSKARQIHAESIVRFVGSNTHHAKLRHGAPSLAFKLRMATTIFMMNGAKYPNRLIARIKNILDEADQKSA